MEEDDDIMADSLGTNMAAGHPEHSLHTSPPSMADNQNSSSEKNIPRVGMCFQSEEEAYKFYNLYAESNGFSIRRCHRKYRADGTLSSRYFVCSKSGVKATHPTHVTKKEQPNSRTACMARVQFSITREGIWNVQKVILDHNHQLISPEEISKTMVPFKAPERVKARMEKRSKDALEGAKKGKKKGKVSNHPAKESVLAPLRVDQQNTSPFLEPETARGPDLQAEWVDNTNPYTTVPFGEYQPAFVPPIHGEFTRLLFGVHGDGTTTAARQLDFGEGASASGFQQ